VVRQDENKTDHPRWWKLSPGVAPALQAWKKTYGEVEPTTLVFARPDEPVVDFEHLADRVREHIAAAGLTRPELLQGSAKRRHFTAHCLRHSFVTRSLANGKTDDWVRSRTGHRSNELLRYREVALSLTELELGEVLPLDEAIPELGVGQKVGQTRKDLAHPAKKRAENRNNSKLVRERGLAQDDKALAPLSATPRGLLAHASPAKGWAAVREKGLEPSRVAPPEPKSGASASSATRAGGRAP
jgi:hypothetical protein